MKNKKLKNEPIKAKLGTHFYCIGQLFVVTGVKGSNISAKLFGGMVKKGSK